MPYRHAHWWLLGLIALAGVAFWPGYLSQFRTASFEFHAHGLTATCWLLLLTFQSWSVHNGQRSAHRTAGLLGLVLLPLFLAGGVGIFIGMARRYVDHASPFHTMYAPKLAWLDIVAVGSFALFFFMALKYRRKVHVHSRYLLATPIFLLSPIFGRLLPILPPLSLSGPQDYWKLTYSFQIANLMAMGIALFLAARSGKHGRPFLLTATLIGLSAVLYEYPGGSAWWGALYAKVAGWPVGPMTALATGAGAAIGWAGWIAGRRAAPSAAPLTA